MRSSACFCPYKGEVLFSNPQPGLILTHHCNWTPGSTVDDVGPVGALSAPRLLLASHSSCHCPAASNNSHRGTHASHFTDGNTQHCSNTGRFIDGVHPTHSYEDECLHACLARAPAFRLSRYLRMNSDFLKAGSSLSLCISVSPHHSGGRPTKAFVSQGAVQQKLHNHADSVLLMKGKGRWREEEKSSETKKEREIQLWRKKGL